MRHTTSSKFNIYLKFSGNIDHQIQVCPQNVNLNVWPHRKNESFCILFHHLIKVNMFQDFSNIPFTEPNGSHTRGVRILLQSSYTHVTNTWRVEINTKTENFLINSRCFLQFTLQTVIPKIIVIIGSVKSRMPQVKCKFKIHYYHIYIHTT